MTLPVHQRIRILIEQTSEAYYGTDNQGNADYAEFATLAISDFKNVLESPNLTRSQLSQMLRRGMIRHQDKLARGTWSAFMAAHIARAANTTRA